MTGSAIRSDGWPTRLDPERSDSTQLTVGFHCTDTGTSSGIVIRSAVADVLDAAPSDATIEIQTTELALRGLLAGRVPWASAAEDGVATLNRGTTDEAAQFWSLFDPPLGLFPSVALR